MEKKFQKQCQFNMVEVANNATEIMNQSDIDGALVGGDSLKAEVSQYYKLLIPNDFDFREEDKHEKPRSIDYFRWVWNQKAKLEMQQQQYRTYQFNKLKMNIHIQK